MGFFDSLKSMFGSGDNSGMPDSPVIADGSSDAPVSMPEEQGSPEESVETLASESVPEQNDAPSQAEEEDPSNQ